MPIAADLLGLPLKVLDGGVDLVEGGQPEARAKGRVLGHPDSREETCISES